MSTASVKKVGEELRGGSEYAVIPDSREEIAQYIFLYEMSGGDPEDLFKFITPENDRANVWVQMRRGENREVVTVIETVREYIAQNPPPGLEIGWAGLPYINTVWQNKMVAITMMACYGKPAGNFYARWRRTAIG